MPIENLTTGDEGLQVNSEGQDPVETPAVTPNEDDQTTNVDGSISNEEAEKAAYAEAWDNVDLESDAVFDNVKSTNDVPTPLEPAAPAVDPLSTTNDTNNNIGAFMVDKPVLKFKGKDIPIDSTEELINLAQKGMQMETTAAEMKPKKKILRIVEGIPAEVLQAVADIHSGNKDAISYIKKQYGIEDTRSAAPKEADSIWDDPATEPEVPPVKEEASTYSPVMETEDPLGDYWNEFAQSNPTVAAKVNETYSALDESFKSEVYTADVFKHFISSVESGEFDKAYPIAIKEKSLNPAMTWVQAMAIAARRKTEPARVQTEPPASATPPANTSAADRNMGEQSKADRVWNDDAYFNDLEAKLFG